MNRPLVESVFGLSVGIIGGQLVGIYPKVVLLFAVFLLLCLGILEKQLGSKRTLLLGASFIIGMSITLQAPVLKERAYLQTAETITVEGKVVTVKEGTFYTYAVIESVKVNQKSYQAKMQLNITSKSKILMGDQIKATGTVLALPEKMNPSDYNTLAMWNAKGLIGAVKTKEITVKAHHASLLQRLHQRLEEQITSLFKGEDDGIIEGVLLGDKAELNHEMYSLYTQTGIAHVLAVSGFHVGVMLSLFMMLGRCMKLNYTARYLFASFGIWSYAFLTGMQTSVQRAVIMMTVLIGARCLWEEEDALNSLALAAWLILIKTPFALFTPGFQLSFMAVIGLYAARAIKERYEEIASANQLRLWHFWGALIGVNLMISPILAYHFFEVPIGAAILNLMVIPLFSYLIIGSWIALGMDFLGMPLAKLLAKSIIWLLQGVKGVCQAVLKMPFAIWCTGKPTIVMIIIYYALLLYVFYWCYQRKKVKSVLKQVSVVISLVILIGCLKNLPNQKLKVTMLYVGQGDGVVVELPNQKCLISDGGPKGQGKTLVNYLKYRGKRAADYLLLSHSDSDHIEGFREMIASDFKVKGVILSAIDHSDELTGFLQLCKRKKIPVYRMQAGDFLQLGAVKLCSLAPRKGEVTDCSNNFSLVYTLNYKQFSMLFTGDIEKEKLREIEAENISILKVSHHGSKTGTSKELLLKLDPKYAMISAGKKNRYGHPHQEVISLLNQAKIPYGRTDERGAIMVETDGYQIKVVNWREDE